MNNKKSYILALAAALTMLFMLPLPLKAQHVITRNTGPKPKVEKKSNPKQNPSSPRKNQAARGSSNSKPADEQQRVIANLISNMVYVSGGTFTMGATAEQGSDAFGDEKPAHQVTLTAFRIGKCPVTQREWKAVMGSNPSNYKGDNRPVEWVTWDECQEFIQKLNALTGKQFRLPTEAEWEYAARGGSKSRGYKYSGGDNINKVAWYIDNGDGVTHNVKAKMPNELGLYDMAGNVWEWCQDWYGKYSSAAQTNPAGPSSASKRVYRGGSWLNGAEYCRVSYRGNAGPSYRAADLGFRLAL